MKRWLRYNTYPTGDTHVYILYNSVTHDVYYNELPGLFVLGTNKLGGFETLDFKRGCSYFSLSSGERLLFSDGQELIIKNDSN